MHLRLVPSWAMRFLILFCTQFVACAAGSAPASVTSGVWRLGICNPSGLQGKAQMVGELYKADVLAISETHLTHQGRQTLSKVLRATTPFSRLVTGAPLAPRSSASDAGLWSGVAFASSFPCRPLPAPWPPDLFDTGRVQFASCLCHFGSLAQLCMDFHRAACIAMPTNVPRPSLDLFCFRHLDSLPGPRYFCGDWNYEPHQLQVVPHLLSRGWVEVQDLALKRFGRSIQKTRKSCTRKDHLWLSTELAAYFVDLVVDPLVFADRSVLIAKFDFWLSGSFDL